MTNVQKNLIALEDLALGTGTVVQDRAGVEYVLYRLDAKPSVNSVEDLTNIAGYTKARVGLVNYKFEDDTWVIDPIPLEALGSGLGPAASRDVTGAGDLIAKGFAGIGGVALANLVGAGVGLKASYVETIDAGGPVDEPTVVLTLPGPVADAARLAITLTNIGLYVQKVGLAWHKVALENTAVEFTALKADSVRADSVGTPKE